jgi:hypothetical protein
MKSASMVGWWRVALAGGRIEHVRPEHQTEGEASAAALRVWGLSVASAERVTEHAAACIVAGEAVAPIAAQIEALRAGNPGGAREHAAGRYYWPALDGLIAQRHDAWLEAALRAGADPDKLGPRADVAHIRRRIAIAA